MKELLKRLLDERKAKRARLDEFATITAGAEGVEARSLTETEDGEFATLLTEIRALDARIAELDEQEQREAGVAAARARLDVTSPATVGAEARTYRPDAAVSYFRDLYKSQKGDVQAVERLQRHAQEVTVEARTPGTPEARALSRTDGSGGNFVPPGYLISEYAELARAGRPFANACATHDLPTGVDSVKLPRILTGTTTAAQTADNQTISETDLTDDEISAPVRTVAGQQGVALQLLEQSPIGFDEVVFADLTADYAVRMDTQLITGTGANGQHTGLFTLAGGEAPNAVTYTDASPTAGELYAKIADGIQRIHTLRKRPPTHIFMSPRRWAFFLAALDGNGRPLVVPASVAFNAVGVQNGVESEGPVGTLQGLPVYVDSNLPENLGAGTNEDRIVIARMGELHLWEGALQSRALEQIRGDKLQVLLQVYAYSAFLPNRYPKATSVISGTGLVTPTF